MIPNNEPSNEKSGSASPSFEGNMGRLSRLPPEERKAIARKGGQAKSEKKRLSCQLNPIKTGSSTNAISISQCDNCPTKETCLSYRNGKACQIELNLRRNALSQFKAIAGTNPEDLLKEMYKTYSLLEQEVRKTPTYSALLQQIYLLMSIYEMKFGKLGNPRQGINIPIRNSSSEVKEFMRKLRKMKD